VNELQSEPEIEPADDEALDPALELLPEDHALKLSDLCIILPANSLLCPVRYRLTWANPRCSIVFVSSGARPGRGTHAPMRACSLAIRSSFRSGRCG
jgi:hypothetical protein